MFRVTIGLVAAAAAAFWAPDAFAHEAHGGGMSWTWEPGVLVPLTIAVVWYGRGLFALADARRLRHVVGALRLGLFAAGIVTVLVALESPLDEMSDSLFSAHMVQHLLLIIVAAPLFVFSRPTTVFLWGLPRSWRCRVLRGWRSGAFGLIICALLNPLVVWIAFCGAFVFWHVPGPYNWALRNEVIHSFEHLCFFVTALAYWEIVFDPSAGRRLDYGATLVFIVTTAVLSGLPGALLLLAPRALYAAHPAATEAWGLTPLQDQQLAGVIMWVPMGFAYVAAGAWAFLKWMETAAAREAQFESVLRQYRTVTSVLLLGIASLLLVGGSANADPLSPERATGGDPHRGAKLIEHYGCGYCHTIPGIANANGRVGPPLIFFGERLYVAGVLPNTPDNLIAWIENPQRIVPGNVMPVLGVNDHDARDIAAYLYTLHR